MCGTNPSLRQTGATAHTRKTLSGNISSRHYLTRRSGLTPDQPLFKRFLPGLLPDNKESTCEGAIKHVTQKPIFASNGKT